MRKKEALTVDNLKESFELSLEMRNRDAKTPLLPIAAVVLTAACVLALLGAARFFSADAAQAFLKAMYDGGVGDARARDTWLLLRGVIGSLVIVLPMATAAGLWTMLYPVYTRGSAAGLPGLRMLSGFVQGFLYLCYALGIFLAVLFVYRFIAYTIQMAMVDDGDGFYPWFSMLVTEGFIGAVAVGLYWLLIKFLRAMHDALGFVRYINVTAALDAHNFSSIAWGGLYAAGIVCAILALVFMEFAPMAVAFGCCTVGNILLGVCLQRYKSKIEWRKHQNKKGV